MKSSLAIVMFADLVGYSAMMEENHSGAMASIHALKSEYLEPTVAVFDGEVLKRMGDGWIITFPTVSASVQCAIDVQNRLLEKPGIKLRIGCHVGEVVEDDHDYYGSGLNIAQRVQTEAPPGGFMVSEDLYRQSSPSDRANLTDAGTFRLKNISQPVRLFQWRPARGPAGKSGNVPSIAVIEIDHAPLSEETRALAGDLRDQLLTRMSRRVGIVIFDGEPGKPTKATYLLRGRLRTAGGRGRLSLSLVLREENRPVWSETYEGETGDIFAFCDDMLEQAENDLRLQTNAFDGDRLAHLPDEELSVSELRARAANNFYKTSYSGWQHALELMERAVRLNPMDGVALSMRAEAQAITHAARYEKMSSALLQRTMQDLDNAVEHTPRSDYVFWARGMLRIKALNDIPGATADLKRCRELNPAYVEGHELAGMIRMRESRFHDATAAFAKSLAHSTHNPLNPYRLFMKSVAQLCDEEFEKATENAADALDQRPNDRGLQLLRAICLGQAHDIDSACRIVENLDPGPFRPSIVSCEPVLPDEKKWIAGILGADAIRP